MKTKVWFFFAFVVSISALHGQIGAKTKQGVVHGVWTNKEFGFQMTLILNAGGSGEFDAQPITFVVYGDKLHVTGEGITTIYTYALKENILMLSGGDLDQPINFTRAGSDTNVAVSSEKIQDTASEINHNIPANLLGVWSGYNETIEFKSDAQCLYRGQILPYSVSNNVITLQTHQGNFMMNYSVEGSQLKLTFNGQQYIYSKPGSEKSSISSISPTGKNVDATMAGKWCYMNVYSSNSGGSSTNECIVLNQDGTYTYNYESSRSVNSGDVYGGTASQDSDAGTWWVQDNRLHYNSPTKGAGSYAFQKRNHPKTGDAMIVLEGRTFVTFFNRPGW